MKQQHVVIWLKSASIAAGAIGALVFFVLAPYAATEMKTNFPEFAYLFWPCLAWVFVIAALCYAALARFFGVCTRIGADRSFCPENVRAMAFISRCLFAVACMFGLWLLYFVVNNFGNPGLAILLLLGTCVCAGVAVVAKALSLLVARAAELQQENDLTV